MAETLRRNSWSQNPPLVIAMMATLALGLHIVFPQIWGSIVSTGNFMPHSHCYQEDPLMIGLHVGSDLLIGFAYLSISLTLIYMVKRTNVPFHWIFIAFGIFILACGTTHFIEVLTIYQPRYWLAAGVKLVTAAASLITAVALFPIFPKVLALVRTTEAAHAQKIQLEKEVAERSAAEAKFKGLLESAPDAIVITDNSTAIALINTQTENLFGYSRAELLNKSIDMLLPDRFSSSHPKDDSQFFAEPFSRMVEAGLELFGRRKDGSEFPVEISLSPLVTKDGRFVMSAVRDITERKKTEKAVMDAQASLQAANRLLEKSLREKEVLLREIHHRVKNNLQIISGLLSLQAATQSDERFQSFFMESDSRVKSMALIHEMLYQGSELSSCDFATYTQKLMDHLRETYGKDPRVLVITVDMPEIRLTIDDAIPCGLILNEIVSNCMKHAFPNNRPGTLKITLKHEVNTSYRLLISDDGVGLPADFDFKKTNSLGLKLVSTLSRQLGGTFEREPAAVGTSFVIKMKLRTT